MLRILFTALISLLIAIPAMNSYGNDVPQPPFKGKSLIKRKVPKKPSHTKIGKGVYKELIILKFTEGTGVRLRKGRLVGLRNKSMLNLRRLFARHKVKVKRLFSRPEEELDREKERGQKMSGKELADLNLYYMLHIDLRRTKPEALIDALNRLDIVEIAYPEPIPQSPIAGTPYDIQPQTLDFRGNQDYLNAAPQGIDAWYAWVFNNHGEGVRLIDVEEGWNLNHEDLELYGTDYNNTDILGGNNYTNMAFHGTAVLGEIIGYDNAFGVTGIAHRIDIGLVGIWGHASNPNDDWPDNYPNVPNAISIATNHLRFGDIMLIEVQAEAYINRISTVMPVEYWQANFDVIYTATANGIIVIEAAGNGNQNLDDPRYGNIFDRDYRDSGAIMVGAGTSNIPHVPMNFTNYGNRVDVQGWGENVTTTGGLNDYCEAFDGSDTAAGLPVDVNQCYTNMFRGTSSAAPIVAGAAALIQSYFRNHGDPLSPCAMRQLLKNQGTPQAGEEYGQISQTHIGPLPNVRRAITAQVPRPDIKANGSDGPVIVTPSTQLNATMSLDAGGFENTTEAEWRIVADIENLGIRYYYDFDSGQWTPTETAVYQGPLHNIPLTAIYNDILPFDHTNISVQFIVDFTQNGNIDAPYYSDCIYIRMFNPDIKVNGMDGPVSISSSTTATVTVRLDPGGAAGMNADWGIAAYIGSIDTWFYYNSLGEWIETKTIEGIAPYHQGPLAQRQLTVYNEILPSGYDDIVVYFGIDLIPNGRLDLDSLHYDHVELMFIECGQQGRSALIRNKEVGFPQPLLKGFYFLSHK